MDKLLKCGSQPPSDELRAAASRLTEARKEGHVRYAAIDILNQATGEVKDVWIRARPPAPNGGRGVDPIEAARHDAMIEQAHSHDPTDREFACRALSDFPDSFLAVSTLRDALYDPNENVRAAAQISLDHIDHYRKLYRQLPFPTTQP
jgi:hypothetical protein